MKIQGRTHVWRHTANQTGTETLEMLAHDLRTPMCSVAGAAQMALMAAQQGEAVDRQLEEILLAVHTMDRMLTEMVDAPCGQTRFAVGELEGELRSLAAGRAARKGQHLTLDLSALDGLTLEADYAALSRVLINLLANAVKYTQEGGRIELRARIERRAAGVSAVFMVQDNGMGMKRDFVERMYKPFARAQESAHLPGTGLGLSIVRRLVKRLNGRIDVRSEWGKGSLFTVSVPVRIVGNSAYAAAQ